LKVVPFEVIVNCTVIRSAGYKTERVAEESQLTAGETEVIEHVLPANYVMVIIGFNRAMIGF
jgi:hypothetical protein